MIAKAFNWGLTKTLHNHFIALPDEITGPAQISGPVIMCSKFLVIVADFFIGA